MTNTHDERHLDGPVPASDMREMQETRLPANERDTVREAGFDAYSAPELQAASSMSGTSTMQRVVALVLLVAFVFTFVITMFL